MFENRCVMSSYARDAIFRRSCCFFWPLYPWETDIYCEPSLRSKRFRASSSRKLGQKQKKNWRGRGGELSRYNSTGNASYAGYWETWEGYLRVVAIDYCIISLYCRHLSPSWWLDKFAWQFLYLSSSYSRAGIPSLSGVSKRLWQANFFPRTERSTLPPTYFFNKRTLSDRRLLWELVQNTKDQQKGTKLFNHSVSCLINNAALRISSCSKSRSK